MTNPSGKSSRRSFLRRALATTAATTAVPIAALASDADAAEEGSSPYGSLADRDGLGVLLPASFIVEVVAVSGQVVPGTSYLWRGAPDGAATFDDGIGGWYHAVNHETNAGDGGGVSVLHFDSTAKVVDAYSVLTGTNRNCAGGPTPWGTWLSCEEVGNGLVYECFPSAASQGNALPALGTFNHEAVAVDPIRAQLYLTEDRGDGLLYRFTPDNYPDLSVGRLEAASFASGVAEWNEVPDPSGSETDTRYQLPEASTTFAGGEGIWYHNDRVYFTTKGDNGVWDLHVGTGELTRIWAGDAGDAARDQLTGVDNITVENGSGDLYIAEDGGDMEIVLITPDGIVAPFMRIVGQGGSEITGPCFNPSGDRMFFSSQRGGSGSGITYMISGPFRGRAQLATGSTAPDAAPEEPAAAVPDAASSPSTASPSDGSAAGATDEPSDQTDDAAAAETSSTEVDADGADGAGDGEPTIDDNNGATLDADTPDPSSTLTAVTTSPANGNSTRNVVVGSAAVIAGAAGAALIGLRRRQDRVLDS